MKKKIIHFIGIGGISMCAIAKLMQRQGYTITGTDAVKSNFTTELEKLSCVIMYHNAPQLIKNADMIVYTDAIDRNNPDLILAKELHKKVYERADFLHIISKKYKNIIAVSGTHGKTTTTAMIGLLLNFSQYNPTIHIGGISNNFDTNMIIGENNFFVTEACEYKKHLLKFSPTISIITNVEKEHMDCYKDINDVYATFQTFINKSKKITIINGDLIKDKHLTCKHCITFGLDNDYDCYATNIKYENNRYTFDCYYKQSLLGNFTLNTLGEHNVLNALATICVGMYYKLPINIIQKTLLKFKGTKRRLETIYSKDFIMISDYAHHPTEIKTSIDAVNNLPHNNLIIIFEPHTYSRTKTLMTEFSTAFSQANKVIFLPTYSAREAPIVGGDAIDLFYNVIKNNKETLYFSNIESLFCELDNTISPNDIVLWLGAGTIYNYSLMYKEHLFQLFNKKQEKITKTS